MNNDKKDLCEDDNVFQKIQETYPEENEANCEEEQMRWFNKECSTKNNEKWIEFDSDTSELIECKYQEFLNNKDDPDFQSIVIEMGDQKFTVDYLNNAIYLIETKSNQRTIGRFKGDPNLNNKLQNTLEQAEMYRWYFSAKDKDSSEEVYAPYRIADNDAIEKAFVEYSLSKGSNMYEGNHFKIDFDNWQEISLNSNEKNKKIYRLKECPKNITRVNYYNDEVRPVKTNNVVLDEDSITSVKKDFFLNFKNIFPSRCFSDTQTFSFYYNHIEKSIILHLETGWTRDDKEQITGKNTTQGIINEIKEMGYEFMCRLKSKNKHIYFDEINPLPAESINKFFKTNWYYRYKEDNCFIWKQYTQEINAKLDLHYKNRYLLYGDTEDIIISKNLKVNYSKNIQIDSQESNITMMRLNIKNSFPDKNCIINVPEEVFTIINNQNEKQKKIETQTILYANKFGPTSILELIEEIRKELKNEAERLSLSEEFNSLKSNYLDNITNFNFFSLIIKIYTEEGFVYRRINKILRDHDTDLFLNLRYYYISLLYSLKQCYSGVQRKFLYRGMKLSNPDLVNFYDNLETNQMMQSHQFLSTTYDIEIAQKYAKQGEGSYILEIQIPEEMVVSSIENYSRFQHEREVLLPSGSILQFLKKTCENQLTTLSLSLIYTNSVAMCNILMKLGTKVDLSKVDFGFKELQSLFKFLNIQNRISQITLKVFDESLISYYAEYISKSEKLNDIVLIRDGDIISERKFCHLISKQCNTFLKNFSKQDTELFFHYFLKNGRNVKSLDFINLEEISLNYCKLKEYEMNKLQRLIFKNTNKIDNLTSNCISRLFYPSNNFWINLVELYLQGFTVNNEALRNLSQFLKESKSVDKVELTLDSYDQIPTLSKIYESNKSISVLNVYFNYKLKKIRKVTFGEENSFRRKIYFHKLDNYYFINFLNTFFKNNININFLDLSENELNKHNFLNTLILIMTELNSLSTLDLSSNLICDDFIDAIYDYLSKHKTLKHINLENNLMENKGNLTKLTNLIVKNDMNFFSGKDIKKYEYKSSQTLIPHSDFIVKIIPLSNGNFASCSHDKTIKIFDGTKNFNCIYTLQGHTFWIDSIIELFNENIASQSRDGTIKIWDNKKNYECIHTIYSKFECLNSLILLSNGNIAARFNPKEIKIWDSYNNFNCIKTIEFPGENTSDISYLRELSDKNIVVVLYGNSYLLKILDHNNNYACIYNLKTEYLTELLILSNGDFATFYNYKELMIWKKDNNYSFIMKTFIHDWSVNSIIVLYNGNIATSSCDGTIKIWDKNDDFNLLKTIKYHSSNVETHLLELSNGNIVSYSLDGKIGIWDPFKHYQLIQRLSVSNERHCSFIETSKGALALVSHDKKIKVWEREIKEKITWNTIESLNSVILRFSKLSNNKYFGILKDYSIKIWDENKMFRTVYNFCGQNDFYKSLIILSNGDLAIIFQEKIFIWNKNNCFNVSHTLTGHDNYVLTIIELSNGNIATCSSDEIKIWDRNDNFKCIYTLKGHAKSMNMIIELYDGNLASCSNDKTIKIWDKTNNYNLKYDIIGHQENVSSIIELSNGNIASCSDDKNIKIWDRYNNYICIHTLTGHDHYVNSIFELSNGNIVSITSQNYLKIWGKNENYNCIFSYLSENSVKYLFESLNGNIYGLIDKEIKCLTKLT